MSSWFIRRANVVNSAGGRLPAEFTELAYIEDTGTQYINTGLFHRTAQGGRLPLSTPCGTFRETRYCEQLATAAKKPSIDISVTMKITKMIKIMNNGSGVFSIVAVFFSHKREIYELNGVPNVGTLFFE